MSQINFKAEYKGQVVEVMTGWDHPLQYYHLTLFDSNGESIWCNLDQPQAFPKSLATIKNWLSGLEIQAPIGLWKLIEKHERNVNYVYEDGQFRKL